MYFRLYPAAMVREVLRNKWVHRSVLPFFGTKKIQSRYPERCFSPEDHPKLYKSNQLFHRDGVSARVLLLRTLICGLPKWPQIPFQHHHRWCHLPNRQCVLWHGFPPASPRSDDPGGSCCSWHFASVCAFHAAEDAFSLKSRSISVLPANDISLQKQVGHRGVLCSNKQRLFQETSKGKAYPQHSCGSLYLLQVWMPDGISDGAKYTKW